ncbi:MAG: carbamoyltransferase HypF [Kiritimatiellae bacterium]|nr:carbamoyltransferase HypF [Kiritimatiellia bacterium]
MQVLEFLVSGAVQGVGFRPLVYRIAHQMGLGGAVWNEPGGVRIRIVGPARNVEQFGPRLRAECAAPARIDQLRILSVSEVQHTEPFRIAESMSDGARQALVMPDLATCPACLRELLDSKNRRYRYPFINCTHCGPRYSIITGIPYDRPQTTMRGFKMCEKCQAEYDNPDDRRFHAQPNACPDCGPQLELLDATGKRLGGGDWALRQAIAHLRDGRIVAMKGIGGFHLMCDAKNEDAVKELRRRKRREEKPLAIMTPNLAYARLLAKIGDDEAEMLQTSAAPIILLPRRADAQIAESVAPHNPYIGLMLPYSPLHHLLLHGFQGSLVATSGNISDEPICIGEQEAIQRLAGIADIFLVHNRPIVRALDDSVVRMTAGKMIMLRRARGYAPLALPLPLETSPVLALGPHLKNTVALAMRDRVVVSQHIGDLDTLESRRAFEQAVDDLQMLYGEKPDTWVIDKHPDYASSLFAHRQGRNPIQTQHHHAHIVSVIAEHDLREPVLGVAWDGTGLGDDGTIWGGEFLRATPEGYIRLGHLKQFRLPSGDGAMRKPIHSAFGALYACFPEQMPALAMRLLDISGETAKTLQTLIEKAVNAPLTSSAGRWFDAVAALSGICRESAYEGIAAQRLEHAMNGANGSSLYPFDIVVEAGCVVFDLKPMLEALLADRNAGVLADQLSLRFHNTMINIIVRLADAHRGLPIVLGGGCFQNKFLLDSTIQRLREAGHAVYWPQLLPPNDGGLALGQAVIAARTLKSPRQT